MPMVCGLTTSCHSRSSNGVPPCSLDSFESGLPGAFCVIHGMHERDETSVHGFIGEPPALFAPEPAHLWHSLGIEPSVPVSVPLY